MPRSLKSNTKRQEVFKIAYEITYKNGKDSNTYLVENDQKKTFILKKIRVSDNDDAGQIEREIQCLAEQNLLYGFRFDEVESKLSSKELLSQHISIYKRNARHIKKREYSILIECIPGVNFDSYLSSQNITAADALIFFYHLAKSLDNFHKSGYVHRDVKPNNFIIGKDQMHLVDFGESVKLKYTKQDKFFSYGAAAYAAPETMDERDINDEKSDVFSLGISYLFTLKALKFQNETRMPLDFENFIPSQLKAFGFSSSELSQLLPILRGMVDDDRDKRYALNTVIDLLREMMELSPRITRVQVKDLEDYYLKTNIPQTFKFKPMNLEQLTLHGYKNEDLIPPKLRQLIKRGDKGYQDSASLLPGLHAMHDYITNTRGKNNRKDVSFLKDCRRFISDLKKSRGPQSRLNPMIEKISSHLPRQISPRFFPTATLRKPVKQILKNSKQKTRQIRI